MTISELKEAKQQILAKIKESDNFAILTSNPDEDAIGTALVFKEIFDQLGKKYKLLASYKIADFYNYLPFVKDFKQVDFAKFDFGQFSVLILTDSGDPKRVLDKYLEDTVFDIPDECFVINIDHHATNPLYGDLNYVTDKMSSAAEGIYEILNDDKDIKITATMATNLLAGIIGDSGCFRYSTTSPRTLEIAAALMKLGADHQKIVKNIYYSFDKKIAQLNIETLKKAKFEKVGKYEFLYSVLDATKFGFKETERRHRDIVQEVFKSIGDIDFSLMITPVDEGRTKLSFRSNKYDITSLAYHFGGGGHPPAAGSSTSLSPTEVLDKLREFLKNAELKPLKD